jgi:hypothetical protein
LQHFPRVVIMSFKLLLQLNHRDSLPNVYLDNVKLPTPAPPRRGFAAVVGL